MPLKHEGYISGLEDRIKAVFDFMNSPESKLDAQKELEKLQAETTPETFEQNKERLAALDLAVLGDRRLILDRLLSLVRKQETAKAPKDVAPALLYQDAGLPTRDYDSNLRDVIVKFQALEKSQGL